MMVGAQAQQRQNAVSQQYQQQIHAQRRRAAIARRNQQIYAQRQRQQNYWSRLGVSIKSVYLHIFNHLHRSTHHLHPRKKLLHP